MKASEPNPMKSQTRIPLLWLGGISLFYFVSAGLRAWYRPLWYDELVTWHVARLSSIADMWNAICAGVDQEMPLTHLTVRLSHALFGDGNLATRLPMLIGFWIMLMCLYRFLSRRVAWPYALLGMVFPMLTYAWPYAFEARAYGIALAGTGIALVSWQNAAEGRGRPWSLVGITLGLVLVLATQATLSVVAIPFALGEAVRTYDKRRIDWAVWLAFAAASPVAIMYPFVRSGVKHLTFSGLQSGILGFPRFYDEALRTAIFPLLLAIAIGCWLGHGETRVDPQQMVPRHEAGLLLGFVLTPLPFFVGGLISNQLVFFPRYGMLAIIGLACWLGLLTCRIAGGGNRIATAMVLTLMLWLIAGRGKEAFALRNDPGNTWRGENQMLAEALQRGLPVVVASTHSFLEGDHYFPAEKAANLYWITADPEIARRYTWVSFSDLVTIEHKKRFPLRAPVTSWNEFAARTEPFYLYIDAQPKWFYEVLHRDDWRLIEESTNNGWTLYLVQREAR
jgi:hypothetical protein